MTELSKPMQSELAAIKTLAPQDELKSVFHEKNETPMNLIVDKKLQANTDKQIAPDDPALYLNMVAQNMTTQPKHTPTHFIEVKHKGATYRYYGWAHVKGAKCIGDGDWRALDVDNKEVKTFGAIIPADVLRLVADEVIKQEGREVIAKLAEADGEIIFAREVRDGAWDDRSDVKNAIAKAQVQP